MTFFHSLWNFLLCNIFSSQAPMVFRETAPFHTFGPSLCMTSTFFPQPPFLSQKKKGGRTRRELDRERLLPLFPFPPDLYFPFFSSLLTFPEAPPPPPPPPLPSRERRSGERGRKQSSLSLFSSPFRSPKLFPFLLSSFAEKAGGRGAISPVLYLYLSLSLSLSKSVWLLLGLCVLAIVDQRTAVTLEFLRKCFSFFRGKGRRQD